MSHSRWHSALTLILTNPYSYHYPLSEKFLETRTMVTLIMGGGGNTVFWKAVASHVMFVQENSNSSFSTRDYDFPSCRVLTRLAEADTKSLLWNRPQIQLESSCSPLQNTCYDCTVGIVRLSGKPLTHCSLDFISYSQNIYSKIKSRNNMDMQR